MTATRLTIAPVAEPASAADWYETVDRLRAALGAPHNPTLLPPHFSKAVFRRMGGKLFTVHLGESTQGELAAVIFAMPRAVTSQGECCYLLRLHRMPSHAGLGVELDGGPAKEQMAALLAPSPVELYDPEHPAPFLPTHQILDGLDYGRPDADEVAQVRQLQQRVWGVPDDSLYPADLHAPGSGRATSLVARDAATGQVVGSLLGFYKWDETPLPPAWAGRFRSNFRVESQSLAVDPAFRGRGIGFALKRMQAQRAQIKGIDLVEWTTDPLLFTNAMLNFGKLRALCIQFLPDFIPFRNALNQVSASRLRMTLLAPSARVQAALGPEPDQRPGDDDVPVSRCVRVNDGWSNPTFGVDAPNIAIEIPADWSALQRTNLEEAVRWRATTDRLLSHYVGSQPGRYVLTASAAEGERRFLIGRRVEEGVLEQLSEIG